MALKERILKFAKKNSQKMKSNLITIDDIANVKPITPNNKNKAGQIILEVQDLWFSKLLGVAFYDYIRSTSDNLDDLMDGCSFSDCHGNTRYQPGLKKVLVYLFWSRYVYDINVVDTPTGMVSKTRTDSEQLSMGHLNNLSSNYETMAMNYFEQVRDYIMQNKSQYPLFKGCLGHTTNIHPSIKGVKNNNLRR